VPRTSDFYEYIETAVEEGIISGYDNPRCSSLGVAAPCFLPGEGITRQQMAKMNALAAGFTDDLTTKQATYADVPRPANLSDPNDFFQYVERLTMHTALGPYPPELAQPICSSATKPCFHPEAPATRADAMYSIYRAYHYSPSSLSPGSLTEPIDEVLVNGGLNSPAQVFPHRAHVSGQLVGFNGVYAVVETPNPPGIAGGAWVAAPIAISDYYNEHFSESGPMKLCVNIGLTLQCELVPYATWRDGDGNGGGTWDTTRPLTPGTKYGYRTDPIEGNRFKSTFCPEDEAQCFPIHTSSSTYVETGDLGTSSLLYYLAGGESNSLGTHWGNISIYNVSARRPDGAWFVNASACYDPSLVPITSQRGSYSPCIDASWQVRY
jgi:hypothetical protein